MKEQGLFRTDAGEGIAYSELCDRLVQLALERYSTVRSYEF